MPFLLLVHGAEDGQPCLAQFWSSANDLDDAAGQLTRWLPHVRRLDDPHLLQVWLEGRRPASFHATPVSGLFEGAERRYTSADDSLFVFPRGVAPTDEDGQVDPDSIGEGWTLHAAEYDDPPFSEAVIDGRRWLELVESSCASLPSTSPTIEIRLEVGDLDDPRYEVWRAEQTPQGVDAWTFLSLYAPLFLENGKAAITLHDRDGQWSLEFSEHKTLRWRADDALLQRLMPQVWTREGISQVEELASLEHHCGHVHYQPPADTTPQEVLLASGFRLADRW